MTYETEGYVKSIKISANSSEETGLDFVPTGAYLMEENGQAHCLVKAGTSDGNDKKDDDVVVEAKLLRFDKAKSVSMQIKNESLRNALITAKVNHSKIRVEIDGNFIEAVGKSEDKKVKPTIITVEFV